MNSGFVDRQMYQVVVRLVQGRERRCVIRILSVGVRHVQCFSVSRAAWYILLEIGKRGGQGGMTEISRDENECGSCVCSRTVFLGRQYGLMLMANSSTSLQHICSLIVMCPESGLPRWRTTCEVQRAFR